MSFILKPISLTHGLNLPACRQAGILALTLARRLYFQRKFGILEEARDGRNDKE